MTDDKDKTKVLEAICRHASPLEQTDRILKCFGQEFCEHMFILPFDGIVYCVKYARQQYKPYPISPSSST